MVCPTRWLRQQYYRLGIRPQLRCLRQELRTILPELTTLKPSRHDGGYDSIFTVMQGTQPVAVARINNRLKNVAPLWPGRPRYVLPSRERIEREWAAYQQLAPLGLSPCPLWRSTDCIVCSFVSAPRLREVLERSLLPLETAFDLSFAAVAAMHRAGIRHFDLTPGNILICPESHRVTIIDFEYETLPSRSVCEQQEFDVLLLLAKILERGVALDRCAEFQVALANSFQRSALLPELTPNAMADENLLDLDQRRLGNEAFKTWFDRAILPQVEDHSRRIAA